jgi:hypothetical protein
MKKGQLMWGPIVKIVLVLALIIVGYLFLAGGSARLAPIFGKLGIIGPEDAMDEEREEWLAERTDIPAADRQRIEAAIRAINTSIMECAKRTETQACTCPLEVPDVPDGYIIRVMEIADGGTFLAGYKANWNNGEDHPGPSVLPMTMTPKPCFSSTLWDGQTGEKEDDLAKDDNYRGMTPREAISTLSPVREAFLNLEMDNNDPRLYVVVPPRFSDCSERDVTEFLAKTKRATRYRLLGSPFDTENLKLLRFDSGNVCFITDREDDSDGCDAGVDSGPSVQMQAVVDHLPRCGEPDRDVEAIPDNVLHLMREARFAGWKARTAAVASLGRLGDTRAIPAVTDALRDSDKGVRATAALVLGTLVDSSVEANIRDHAIDELYRVKENDGEEFVRTQAERAYEKLKDLRTST